MTYEGNMHSGGSGGDDKRRLIIGLIAVGVLIVFAVILVPLACGGGAKSPKGWLDDNLQHVSGSDPDDEILVYKSNDDPSTTASRIVSGTKPSERRQSDSTYYLRYGSEWLVTVKQPTDGSAGSTVEFTEFDRGYRSSGGALFFWSSHYGRGGGLFRGGSSGGNGGK